MNRPCSRVFYSVFLLALSVTYLCGTAFADPPGMPSMEELQAKIRPQMPTHLEMTGVEMSNVKTRGNAMMSMISADLVVHAKLKEAMYRADGMQDGKIRLYITHPAGEETTLNAALIAVIPGGMLGQGQGQVNVTLLPGKGAEGQPLSFYQPNSYVIADEASVTASSTAPAQQQTPMVASAPTKATPVVTAQSTATSKAQSTTTNTASTPEWVKRLLAVQRSEGEVWGKTFERQVGSPFILKQIKQTSATTLSGVVVYPFANVEMPFTGEVTPGQLILREQSVGKYRAHTYILSLQGDELKMSSATLIPLTVAASKQIHAEFNRHLKPWRDEKEIPALFQYGAQLWNIDSKQLLDDDWVGAFVRPIADLPGRYWTALDTGLTMLPAGALAPARTYDPAGRLPLNPFASNTKNIWLSPNRHTFVQLKNGDLWRGEVDWQQGALTSATNVSKIGMLSRSEPLMWYGNDFYLRRQDATAKPIVKINIQSGAISEMEATTAFTGKQASSNGRFKFFSDGRDGLLHVYDAKNGVEFTLEATRYQRAYGNVVNERPQPTRIDPVYWINGHTFFCDVGWYDLDKRSRLVLVNLPAVKAEVPAQVTRKNYILIPGGDYMDVSFEGYQTDSNGALIPEKRVYKRYRINRLTQEAVALPLELQNPEALKNHRQPISEYRATWIDANRYVVARTEGGLSEVGTWLYDLRTQKHTRVSGLTSHGGGTNPLFIPGQDFDFMEPTNQMEAYLVFPDKDKIGFSVELVGERGEKITEYHIVSLAGGDTMVLDVSNTKHGRRGGAISRLVSRPVKLLAN